MQSDVWVGNTITPDPVPLAFPALLEAQGHVLLRYPLDTILAEKTAASMELGTANTHQKDFCDLVQLSLLAGLEAEGIRTAFERTFAARSLDLRAALGVLELVSVDPDMARCWSTYLRRSQRSAPLEFAEAMTGVLALLGPLLEVRARGRWQPSSGVWVKASG